MTFKTLSKVNLSTSSIRASLAARIYPLSFNRRRSRQCCEVASKTANANVHDTH